MKEKEKCTIKEHRTEEQNIIYTKRLNRIEGQVKDIKKMIDEIAKLKVISRCHSCPQ